MKERLSKEAFYEIRNWIYRNARPLELELWRYHFENGSKEAVLETLCYYQNEDGGFGNAIDADNWNPESSPYNVQFALKVLRQINFYDISHPIYQGIFSFLEHTEYKEDYGWYFTIPSNDNYPHAIWWSHNPHNIFQSIGPTAILSGFILRYDQKESKLYEMALGYAIRLMEQLPTTDNFGDMGVNGYRMLLEDIECAGLQEHFDFPYLSSRIHDIIQDKIKNELTNFMAKPLEFVVSKDSKYYDEYKEEVELELDHIIRERPDGGVWDIPWQWYNGDQYDKEFSISRNWWRSCLAIEKLLQLKEFERL